MVLQMTTKQLIRLEAVKVIKNLHASGVYKRGVIPIEAMNDDIGIILDELRVLRTALGGKGEIASSTTN